MDGEIQFENKNKKNFFAYVSMTVKENKLIFKIEEVHFNPKTITNKTFAKKEMDLNNFNWWVENWKPLE